MQETSNGAEKIDCISGQFFFASAVLQAVFLTVGDLPQPRRRLIVAQSSRGVLDVRFQVIDRISVAGMAFFGELGKFREQKGPCLFFGTRKYFFREAFEQLFISCQESAVQKREMKFRVVFFDAFAFLERASSGTHSETEIP